MAKSIIILLALFLSACASDYVHPTLYEDIAVVRWIRTDNPEPICQKRGAVVYVDMVIQGCATWNQLTIEQTTALLKRIVERKQYVQWGTIYAPQVRHENDENTTILGHEVNHIFTGNYHD